MERERFEAIASGRSSIQSVPRSEGKSGLRAGGQARQLGGRCYSGKKNQKTRRATEEKPIVAIYAQSTGSQSWKRGRTNERFVFFRFLRRKTGTR